MYPLHLACARNIDIIKLLIDNFKEQIDLNLTDKFGATPLFYACSNNNPNETIDTLKLLIDNFNDSIDIMILNDTPYTCCMV